MKQSPLTKILPSLQKASIEDLEDIILEVKKIYSEKVQEATNELKGKLSKLESKKENFDK